ncbi:Predicted nucleic acid-binding protein, contains PIN domain [Caldanaerobius fijiensis DSM 17918]|uniref:Predicted nucleic acid-binding protein, contains PIN domain n=1 Tax=Caldanaerobius fijiensis DSM 17918 TaxID=1121256 RepID=A0A1M5EBZ5_9THEO|nr:PIN domain-containing protein [Caldanaerobius fijiensis]SHF76758.1 Predicted nucleic acid-binding protein, contains PIN domain [Caldanaerobius fijiensis DSM 17918]
MGQIDVGKKVALDTNLFIYLMEKNEIYFSPVKSLFDKIQKGQLFAVTSVLVYTELLSKPFQEENVVLADKYRVLLATFPNLTIKEVDKDISLLAAKLRAKYKIKTPDAIFIATGIAENADVFVTNDVRLKNIEEIEIVLLEQLLDQNDEQNTNKNKQATLDQKNQKEMKKEDQEWLNADLVETPEYDWGPEGPPEGKPVKYIEGVGLIIEDKKTDDEK